MKINFYRRYRDKERSNSPNNENVVTSAPTFKADDKKPISVKAPPVSKSIGSVTAQSTRTTKKGIDMGAASNYGKNNDLGINSPTHRNSHNEDLFGNGSTNSSNTKSTSNVIEDIFSESNDDFDPRAGEAAVVVANTSSGGDFGDFESAFGNSSTVVPTAQKLPVTTKPIVDTGFADFSSAFTSLAPTQQQSASAITTLDNDNFLFSAQPTSTQNNSTNNNLLSADLFGNSVLTSAFTTSPQASNNKDLLSDFGDLTLNPTAQGESFYYYSIFY